MKKSAFVCAIIGLSLLLAACGAIAPRPVAATPAASMTATGPSSATPDPCSQANIRDTVKLVNNYIRQFDNYAALASTVAQSQLNRVIPTMQAIRQGAQQQLIPACLTDLKHYELLYMDTTIQTLMSFQSKPTAEVLAEGVLQARKYHDQYVGELARLLGVTLEAPTATAATPGAQGTSQPAETATAATAIVVNRGPNILNLRASPSLTSQAVGVLEANQTATALAKTPNGEWLLVQIPGQTANDAWVYASLVQFTSGDINSLPIVSP